MAHHLKLRKFEIVLDSHNTTYYLGSYVTGKCVIALDGTLDLSKRSVKSYRKAHMNSHFPINYHMSNIIMQGIASSFTGYSGSIEYWIEAEIHRPMFSKNKRARAKLNVSVPLICNELMEPLEKNCTKSEVVTIVCNVSNKSSVRVIPRVTLRQIQTFKQLSATKDNEKTVRRQTTHTVKKQRLEGSLTEPGLSTSHIFHVEIPIDIPISVDCPILTVSYDLHLTVDIPS
ncbi:unnamed protein product, partial [Oppiella nova]